MTWLWWSSGKDSAWALHRLSGAERAVTGLVTTLTDPFDRVAMHGVRAPILRAQARRVGLPLHEIRIPHPCSNEAYEAAVVPLLERAVDEGVEAMAFGDLFLEEIREYRERLLAPWPIEPLFPLWGEDTGALAREMIEGGLEATVTCVDPARLGPEWAGRAWDAAFVGELPDDVDPCGENGEFHTCVTAGPFFDRPIDVEPGEVVEREGFVFADLIPK
ncbi:MAG: ATP-binding protein [Gemmatimonadota bacterium]|nr:ATP-binding protein [Gemmatimonadota bacterium]